MSEDAAPPPKAPKEEPGAALKALAAQLYVEICGRVYAASGEKPQPQAVAQLSFKLAETFEAANLEFNPVARAAREASQKAGVKLDEVQIDFASIGKPS